MTGTAATSTDTSRVARRRRRRWWKLLVPGLIVLYLAMIPLHSVLETDHVEVFPFYKWKLFTHIPDWETFEYALVIGTIDLIDTDLPAETVFLIPNEDVRDWKALRRVAIACEWDRGCDAAVNDVLLPIVRRELGDGSGDSNVDFTIIKADVHLRDVQASMTDFVEGRLTATDFLHPTKVILQWSTTTGRLDATAEGN